MSAATPRTRKLIALAPILVLAVVGAALVIRAMSFILVMAGAYDDPFAGNGTARGGVGAPSAQLISKPPDPASQTAKRSAASAGISVVTAARQPPTRIVLPSIGVDSPVTEVGWTIKKLGRRQVTEWEVADNAVGYHRDSAAPGEPGNMVMSGHNNTKGEVFRNLNRIHTGDSITVYAGDNEYRYVVTEKVLLDEVGASAQQRARNAEWIAPTADERLTLVSCFPYSTNSKRLIVVATRE